MPANKIRDVFIARIKQLMSQYEESEAIDHPSTKGAMREQYLKSFLKEMLPPKFSPVSGFIADMYGNITPQLDLIFADYSELPTIALVSDTVIVPFEIALLTAEVKSRITRDALDQIRRQKNAVNTMQAAILMGAESVQDISQPRRRPQSIGTIIFGFETDVSESELERWVREELGEPSGICVVGKTSIFFNPVTGKVDKHRETDTGDTVLAFIGATYRMLYLLLLSNSTMTEHELRRTWASYGMWAWEGYLSDTLTKDYPYNK